MLSKLDTRTLFSCAPPPTDELPQANAGNFHERVDAFESTFEKMHLSFQLHCRGVQALRQARRRHALPGRHLSNASNASHASRDPGPVGSTAEVDTSRSDTTVDEPDPGDQAEAYLLETKGAELAEIVTSRECQKLVRETKATVRYDSNIPP